MTGGLAKSWQEGNGEGKESVQRDMMVPNKEEKELDGLFLQSITTPFVSLAHSNLHIQYAAAVW